MRKSPKALAQELFNQYKSEITLTCVVSKTARKRYAYPTKKEALLNFEKRTQSCINFNLTNINAAKAYLKTVQDFREHLLNLQPKKLL